MATKMGQIPIGCQLCETEAKIQWKCIDCSLLMCLKCKDKVHSKFKNAANHKIISIQELGQIDDSTKTLKFSDVKCKHHEEQDCCIFCKTCEQLICLKCMAKIHNGHNFSDEEEYVSEREKLREGQKIARKYFDELTNEENELDQQTKENLEENTKIKEEILAQRDALKNAVDQYCEKFINELDQKLKNVSHSVDGIKNKIGQAKKQIEENIGSAEEILCSDDFVRFYHNKERIGTSLNRKEAVVHKPVISMPKFVPGKIAESNFGVFEKKEKNKEVKEIQMHILNCFSIDIKYIHYMEVCPDQSIWIASNKSKELFHIKITENKIKTLAKFDFNVFGIAITYTNDLFAAYHPSTLSMIQNGDMELLNSQFSVSPLIITSIHITKDSRVFIGARGGQKPYPATGKRVVIEMDTDGKIKAEYEYDRNKKRLFTYCDTITTTAEGNIGVVDSFNSEHCGRIIILKGDVINIYNGNHEINKDNPFSPVFLTTTPSDNMIVTDRKSQVFHILNCDGKPLTCYNPKDVRIKFPYALSFSSTGHLYIGCNDKTTNTQKLYKLEIDGF